MKPVKIVSVVGARPQFIKAAVVSRAIRESNLRRREKCQEVMVHTGQHYDENMSDVFFRELDIPAPAYHLGIGNATHGKMTGRMLEGIEDVLFSERPDLVLVYGDTNSTLAGALAAAKLHIPVAHVEAGLRSRNMAMPEEINRIVADQVSDWLFCPTSLASANLAREGVAQSRIFTVGDVMFDAVLNYRDKAHAGAGLQEFIAACNGRFCLATVHRAENTDDVGRLRSIAAALEEVARTVPVVLPLHPRTRNRLAQFGISPEGVHVIDPVGYLDMIALLRDCEAVFTDSGGLQKEAFFFRKPCITLRTETEWQELVDLGVNAVAGFDSQSIVRSWQQLRAGPLRWNEMPYGKGDAGVKIVEILLDRARAGMARPGV